MEWRSVVFSDESRICLYESDGRTRVWRTSGERHLPECIRPLHKGPTSDFIVWRDISYNLLSHSVFLQNKVKNACYIAQVVNPVLLSFIRQGGDVLFQQDNARPHTAAATQRVLCALATKNLRYLAN